MNSKINSGSGLRVNINQSRARQTAKTDFGSVMKTGISKTANAVAQAGQVAAPFIPGGAVLSAAISGVGSLKTSASGMTAASSGSTGLVAGSGTTGGTTSLASSSGSSNSVFGAVENQAAEGDSSAQMMLATKEMQEMNQSFNLQYLGLQESMQADNRQFTLMSNIMKTKHDGAKNAISNVR